MHELHIQGLTKHFGDFVAVEDVSMTVRPDEVLCLLGPSGCGKTTTLRMIAGLEYATEGAVSFGDHPVTELSARDRNVAMAFQFYALYPDLTVAENLVFPLEAENASAGEKEQRLSEIADILQLGSVLERYPHQLSEGEKQRVAVGRCVIRSPNAFLFDEPLSRLDAKLRDEMRGSIRKILATLDRPTVIVTHDQLEAMTMGDRIAVMRDGKVEQVGRPLDVFERPQNTFVAGFIGTPQMNLIEGSCLSADENTISLSLNGERVTLAADQFEVKPKSGVSVTLGFRPRSVRETSEDGLRFADANVTLTENMGAETLVHCDWNGFAVRMLVSGGAHNEGDRVNLSVALGSLTLFGQDGERLAMKSDLEVA